MRAPKKKWKIYVIHHSHTDIGFTDRQEKIERYHIEFIKQAIEISEQARNGQRPEWAGFHWTCETFWAVEQFLSQADDTWKGRFEQALQLGDLGLSANYLNMTELIDYDILHAMTRRAVAYGESVGVQVKSAMTADINGHSWGFAQCLAENGVEHLFSCVHTLHGMYPIGRKQMPFWWETPGGARILVWNGDYYHLGNELGLLPETISSYTIHDELPPALAHPGDWAVAERRIFRYVNQLEAEGFPYDFVPLMVSGLVADNAPPSGSVMAFIRRWNEAHGGQIELEMTTLDRFFAKLRAETTEIAVYKGDWPDWWSDGVASTAATTQLFRAAQRKLRIVKRLDPDFKYVSAEAIHTAERSLMLYAEHTWGYYASVSEPWNPQVQLLGSRKEMNAVQGHQAVSRMLDTIMAGYGEIPLSPGRPLRFKVMNPEETAAAGIAELLVDYWEIPLLDKGFAVLDEHSNNHVSYQKQMAGIQLKICVPVQMGGMEERTYRILPLAEPDAAHMTISSFARAGADRVADILAAEDPADGLKNSPGTEVSGHALTSPFVRIEWEAGRGITVWHDRITGQDMLRKDRVHDAFTPVYEVSPVHRPEEMVSARSAMGRNRKLTNVQRSTGILANVKIREAGAVSATVELLYELNGVNYYSLLLTAYADRPQVDVTVRLHKTSVWDPENVYISLPFGRVEDQLWIAKTGASIRPRQDQLPGTGTDFYSIQEGLALIGADSGIVVATPDTPLLQVGPLAHRQRLLMGHPELANDPAHLYSWVLNNFWETNFKAEVGGFYQFRYLLSWGEELRSCELAMTRCRTLAEGFLSFRVS